MRISGSYFVGIIELINHALPFGKTMVGYYRLFFIISLQVHGHTSGICFGVKLSANHVFIKTHRH